MLERLVAGRHVGSAMNARDEVGQRVIAWTFGTGGAAQIADGPHHQEQEGSVVEARQRNHSRSFETGNSHFEDHDDSVGGEI